MRAIALIALLAILSEVAHAQAPVASCANTPLPARCLLDLAQRESQRVTAPSARYQALAKLLNAAATAALSLPVTAESAARAIEANFLDDANRLDLLMALQNYRTRFPESGAETRLAALALYLGLAENGVGSARLSLMLTACGVLELPEPLATQWQPMVDHGCTPAFLDETTLPGDTDRLMGILLAPIVFYREDEAEAFEAAVDRAHATVRDMDGQMEDKPDATRAAWQQLKAGMYLLHGASFADFGDLLRTRLSAAASYAAVLAAEEIGGIVLAEERASVAALLMRAEQRSTAEQILDETTQLIDDDPGHQRVPAAGRVGFLTALVELLAGEAESLFCPEPDAADSQPAV
ncbi:MAG TPA: hypothetical protein VIS73_00885 [Rhodocyclaceae bacterium]